MSKNKTKKRKDRIVSPKKDIEIIQFLKKHVKQIDDSYDKQI